MDRKFKRYPVYRRFSDGFISVKKKSKGFVALKDPKKIFRRYYIHRRTSKGSPIPTGLQQVSYAYKTIKKSHIQPLKLSPLNRSPSKGVLSIEDLHQDSYSQKTFNRTPIHLRPSKGLLFIEDPQKVSYPLKTFKRSSIHEEDLQKISLSQMTFKILLKGHCLQKTL